MEDSKVKESSGRKLPIPNNIISIDASLDVDFFKWWCMFLRPFVNLTKREVEVVACFLKQRWELSKEISNPAILDEMMASAKVRERVLSDCDLTLAHFYVIMSTLRKNKVFINDTLNPRLIPNIKGEGNFQLLILFNNKKNESK